MIEPLECRIAPAVVLNLTVGRAGVLLVEDAANPGDNIVNVSMDGSGTLHIDPADAATQILFQGNLLALGGALTVSGFSTFDVGELGGSIRGPVRVALGGAPASSFVMFTLGANANQADPLQVGAVTVTVAPTIESASLRLRNVIAQGPVKITGARGFDLFAADDVLFLAAATVDLGPGDDLFRLEQETSATSLTTPVGVTASAPLTLLGGAGVDTFVVSGAGALQTVNAFASIIIDGGAETDLVTLGANGNYHAMLVQRNI